MNRDNEVIAHLRVAADELECVTVEAGRESQFAQLALVPDQTRYFLLHTGGDAVFPSAETGSVIRVVYERNASAYEFLSVVTERLEGGKLAVAFPQFIERRERRASRRLDVRGGPPVLLRTDRGAEVSVVDLSTCGLGIVANRAQARQLKADGIRGVLSLTADLRINVWLDVRHSRQLEDADQMFVGARFLGLSGREQAALRNYIEGRLAEQ